MDTAKLARENSARTGAERMPRLGAAVARGRRLLWTGANDGKKNGRVHGVCRDPETSAKVYIHRLALARHLGVAIAALDNVDHLCRNPTCFNPYHLEDIDGKENTARGDGVITQFKTKEQYGESTVSDDDIAALASGHYGNYRR